MSSNSEQIFSGAQLILNNEVVLGTLVVQDGLIQECQSGASSLPQAIDCRGDYLLPGLIELHTDNMEKHFVPRPGVQWPGRSAVLTHDAQVIASGITTVFDAVSIGDIKADGFRLKSLHYMLSSLVETCALGLTRADHLVHLRCEVSHKSCLELFTELSDNPLVRLVSIMDHAPGQRQFARLDKYIQYYQGKMNFSDAEMTAFIASHQQSSELYSTPFRQQIAAHCQGATIPLASHDDATLAHIEESLSFGMSIAEFPTTLEAAQAAHQSGMKVLMGAPNIVRGGSHSGNVAAAELAQAGVLDILSSDYYPNSLLDASFQLAGLDNPYSLADAIRTVTSTPAAAVGLTDRGSLVAGLRADLVRVRWQHDHPLIQQVWNQGERVY